MTSTGRPPTRGLTAIDGAIALIAVLLIVQMWLLTATLEAFLAGHRGPALPAAIVSQLNRAAVDAMKVPEVAKQLTDLGMKIVGSTPQQLAAFQRAEVAKWAKVVKEGNIKTS